MNGRDSEAGEAAVRDLSGQGGEIAFVAGDVGRAADCERLAAETASRFGGIDVVCANAGVKLADMTEEDIDSIVATNVKGCMLTVKACVPYLDRSGTAASSSRARLQAPTPAFPAGPITGRPRRHSSASSGRPASSWRRKGSRSTPSCRETSPPKGSRTRARTISRI